MPCGDPKSTYVPRMNLWILSLTHTLQHYRRKKKNVLDDRLLQEHAEKLNALRRGLPLSRFNKQNLPGKKTLKRLQEVATAPQLNRKCITQRNKRSQKKNPVFFRRLARRYSSKRSNPQFFPQDGYIFFSSLFS